MLSNYCIGANKHTGYYIGHFGHYIRNYFSFNKNISKNPKINMHTCKAIRYHRVRGFVIVVYFIADGYHGH